MRFVAALDTVIFGVSYSQGQEVDTTGWTRKMLLQFLGNGIIQAAHLTAGAIADRLVFQGDGVSYTVNGEGQVVVDIDPPPPAYDDLEDVDMSGRVNGQVPVWNATSGLWRPGNAGGGAPMILLEAGGSVPNGTPPGALIFEKAPAPTVWDFRLGSLPSGWAKQGAPTETFSGAGMVTTCPAAAGYHIAGLTLSAEYSVEVVITAQSTVSSVMFGPRLLTAAGAGLAASWYHSPSAVLLEGVGGHTYNGSFQQVGVGPPVYPTRLRVRKSGTSFFASYSSDSGATWSADSPALISAAVIDRIGFGSILGAVTATIQQVIYRPGTVSTNTGRAKGWWDGTTLQPLA